MLNEQSDPAYAEWDKYSRTKGWVWISDDEIQAAEEWATQIAEGLKPWRGEDGQHEDHVEFNQNEMMRNGD